MQTPSSIRDKKLEGLRIGDFLDVLWGTKEKEEVRMHIAVTLKALDPDEVLYHIEFPDSDNALDVPICWRIHEWKASNERRQRQIAYSAIEREARFRRDECIEALASAIESEAFQDRDVAMEMARLYVARKKYKLALFYGVDMKEYGI